LRAALTSWVAIPICILLQFVVGRRRLAAAPVLLSCGVGAERGVVLGLATRSEIGPIISP
jgi:hypothetical protein